MKWDTLATAILILCALTTTGVVVYRQLFTLDAAPPAQQAKAVFIENWRSHLYRGVRLGSDTAPVQLIEFADFECPYCSTFHKELSSLRERYARELAVTYVHYPLPGHRFAIPAARVAECANEQGRFEAMQAQLFRRQPTFGLRPWIEFAKEADVPNLPAFESCVRRKDPVPRIVDGQKLGDELGVKGTPTLIVNGWMLSPPPNGDQLGRMIEAILQGKSPLSIDEKYTQ